MPRTTSSAATAPVHSGSPRRDGCGSGSGCDVATAGTSSRTVRRYRVHRGHEAVSEAGQGFYIARLIGGIAERLPELIDGRVETMFEVPGSRSGPKAVAKIFTGHQVAGPLHQRVQNLAGCDGSLTLYPCFRNSPDAGSNSKGPKASFDAGMAWGSIASPWVGMIPHG